MQTDCSPHATPRRRVRRPALFAFAVLAPLMTSGLLRAQLPNPAGYLTFDEGKGTVAHDSSGRNENATLFGAAGWTTGLVGPSALSLPGFSASYAEIPGDVLDTTKSYSVAAWVKLNTVGTNFQTFVSEDGDGQSAFFLQLRGDTDQFSFTILYDFLPYPCLDLRRWSVSGTTWPVSTMPSRKRLRSTSMVSWRIEYLTSVRARPAGTPGSVAGGLTMQSGLQRCGHRRRAFLCLRP